MLFEPLLLFFFVVMIPIAGVIVLIWALSHIDPPIKPYVPDVRLAVIGALKERKQKIIDRIAQAPVRERPKLYAEIEKIDEMIERLRNDR